MSIFRDANKPKTKSQKIDARGIKVFIHVFMALKSVFLGEFFPVFYSVPLEHTNQSYSNAPSNAFLRWFFLFLVKPLLRLNAF
jgi:hypothetical protein